MIILKGCGTLSKLYEVLLDVAPSVEVVDGCERLNGTPDYCSRSTSWDMGLGRQACMVSISTDQLHLS